MKWLDEYEIRARLTPALLASLAVPVVVTSLGLRENPLLIGFLGVFTAIGGPFLLTTAAREPGRRIQDELYRRWGGQPAVRLLLANPNDASRVRRRARISEALGVELPGQEAEECDPDTSRQTYDSVITELKVKARDRNRYPLVFHENCNYGFQRNLLGLRTWGMGISLAGSGVCAVAIFCKLLWAPLGCSWFDLSAGTAMAVVIAGFWVMYPSDKRVLMAGDAYANQLLDASFAI